MIMRKLLFSSLLALLWIGTPSLWAAAGNPNLAHPGYGATFEASSENRDHPVKRLYDARLTHRWETQNETTGAWVEVHWKEPQHLQELWMVNQPTPFDLLLEPTSRTADFPAARHIRIDFPDGTSLPAELRLGTYYQIITLPQPKTTDRVKITFLDLWDNSTAQHTGLGKLQAYGTTHTPTFRVDLYEMYDMQGDTPVQSAKIEIVNPGTIIRGAVLRVQCDGKPYAELALADIPAHSSSIQQLWLPAPFEPGEMTFALRRSGSVRFTDTQTMQVKPYDKNYFDGGRFRILSTNHNDLGFLDTQFATADYRSRELIGPALDLLRDHPEYTYHMESIEYLKEFLERYPERREEIAQRMREGRFLFGASYVQNLQVHVGAEKLARQFYYGRRWLLENFPGCDTRFYSNVDVPGLTYQLPQVLRQAGVDYIIQGRFPWGYYYWEGLDGTSIPLYALRYTASRQLLNPMDNTGWLHFQNIREPYYRERHLPKELIYDFNCDYLPPSPQMITYVDTQNATMKRFAEVWNRHFTGDTARQITPPVLEFSTPERALDDLFSTERRDIETVHGDWPMSWAYFDEPGHREGLLAGRHGHNQLLQAERLNAWLKALDSSWSYPQGDLDQGWLANCWPDHGWGGNRGIITDSINEASYRRSLAIASRLSQQAGAALASHLIETSASTETAMEQTLPMMVYNPVGWTRSDIVSGTLTLPASWDGLTIRDAQGNEIPYEITAHDTITHQIDLLFPADNIPSLGYKLYYASAGEHFTGYPHPLSVVDSLETDLLKIRFSEGGLASLYDKTRAQELLRTDKFAGGEVLQFTAPGVAWNEYSEVTTADFDRTARHGLKTVRAEESPIRYVVEKEAQFPDFTLRQRYILPKGSRELVIETDLLDWQGVPDRELRIAFPMNLGPEARMSYEVPFGTVELNRDEIDYSLLPETTECQFVGALYGRDLPFREAINWVDASSGLYRGGGCLLASDMTVHLFRDESDDPVPYPVVQHVLLSSRKSLAWNPENWFVQPGNHSYRMALYPHDGNWRMAYRKGQAFNMPLSLYTLPEMHSTNPATVSERSFLSTEPANMIFSAVKQAEDGAGLFVRLYEAEGRYTTLRLKGFKPFHRVWRTDLLEYDQEELQVEADGSLRLNVQPWQIVNLRIHW